jgi:hypothetical protein
MSDKFNELIELIISEETDQAKDLFHEIIVDKSRSIYESLIDEEEVVDEDEEVDESEEVVEETDEEIDESDFDESDFDEELGGDAAEEMIDDISADEEGLALEAHDGEEEMEDRVVDLEDALDELKAEFEKLMGDDEGEEEMDMGPEMDMDEPEMEMDPEEEEMDEAEEMEEEVDQTVVREYTEKVAHPSNSEEGEKASGPVGNAKSKPHNGEAKPASSPGTAEKGMTPPKAAKQTKVAGNVDAKQSAV